MPLAPALRLGAPYTHLSGLSSTVRVSEQSDCPSSRTPDGLLLVCRVLRRLVPTILVSFMLVLFVLTISAAAFADDFEQTLTNALEARDKALETEAKEDWRLALDELRRAVALQESKDVRFEIARALARLGLDDQAVEAYRDLVDAGLNERAEREAQAFIGAKFPRMASLGVEGPEGAVVYVRGEKRGTLPLARPIVVIAGKFEVRVERPGQATWVKTVDVAAGTVQTVRTEPDATVAPAVSRTKAPEPVRNSAESAPTWGTPVLIAGGGLVLASAVVVVGSSYMLESERDGLEEACVILEDDVCSAATPANQNIAQEHADAIATLKTVRTAGYVALGVGAVTAAIGLYGVLSSSPQQAATSRARARITRSKATFEWTFGF